MTFDRSALALALLLTMAGRAAADPKSDARARLEEGSTLYRSGDFEGALRKFNEARTLFPSPKLYFNIGQAHSRLGHAAAAVDAFERFLAEATDAPLDRRQDAERFLAEQRPRVGFLRVETDPGAAISVDGQPAGTAPLPRPIPLEPGPHEVAARAAGATVAQSDRVTIAVGQTVEWHRMTAKETPAVTAAPVVVTTAPAANAASVDLSTRVPAAAAPEPLYRRWWPWAIGGAAVAGLAAALLITHDGPLPSGSLGAADQRTHR